MAYAYAVALTGGIATGKSTACSMLTMLGFRVIDADAIAHELLDEHADKIASMFGDAFVSGGSVQRGKLGELVFADQKQRRRLETFLHPLIQDRIKQESTRLDSFAKPYLIDIPLFFENGSYPITRSVVVYTPRDLQIRRLMQRDGIDEAAAEKKIALQLGIEQKRKKADFVIDNSRDIKHLQKQCERFKRDLLAEFERK